MKIYFLCAIVCLSLASCMTQDRKLAQANAHAGVQAMTDPGEEAIAAGVDANIEGATGTLKSELPRSTMTPSQIKENPNKYQKEAEDRRESIMSSGGFWLAGLFGVLGILRFVPGAHQPIVSMVQTMLESKRDKKNRMQEEGLAIAAKTIMDCIEKHPDIGGLKEKIAGKLPPEALSAVQEYLKKFD